MADQKQTSKVYIDGANMFYTQQKLGWFLDWKKLKEFLGRKYKVVEFRYYTGIKSEDDKMKSFLRYLDHINIIPITKPLKVIRISKKHPLKNLYNYPEIYKSNFDVEITADILLDRVNIDQIILLSGDSDFQYLVKRLKDVGKKVTVYSSRKTISWELKLEASEYFYLEDIKNKIERK